MVKASLEITQNRFDDFKISCKHGPQTATEQGRIWTEFVKFNHDLRQDRISGGSIETTSFYCGWH